MLQYLSKCKMEKALRESRGSNILQFIHHRHTHHTFPMYGKQEKKYTTHALCFSKREYQTKQKSRVGNKKKREPFSLGHTRTARPAKPIFLSILLHRGGTWGLRRVCSQPNGNSPMQEKTRLPVLTERRRERKARFVIRTQGE